MARKTGVVRPPPRQEQKPCKTSLRQPLRPVNAMQGPQGKKLAAGAGGVRFGQERLFATNDGWPSRWPVDILRLPCTWHPPATAAWLHPVAHHLTFDPAPSASIPSPLRSSFPRRPPLPASAARAGAQREEDADRVLCREHGGRRSGVHARDGGQPGADGAAASSKRTSGLPVMVYV